MGSCYVLMTQTPIIPLENTDGVMILLKWRIIPDKVPQRGSITLTTCPTSGDLNANTDGT